MKYTKNKQNDKFQKQVNHLSSFIGMPMWNGRNPTLSEIREYDRLLLEKQALGFEPKRRKFFSRLFGFLTKFNTKPLGQLSKMGRKTNDIKHEIIKSKKTSECC